MYLLMLWRLLGAVLVGLLLYFLLSFRNFQLTLWQRLGLALLLTLLAAGALLLLSFFAVFLVLLFLVLFILGVIFFISRKLRLK